MKWVVPIMGFRESTRHKTGMEKLWQRIRPLADRRTVIVTPYEWDEDLGGLANFILRNSHDGPTEAMVIAYSWGCGVGFLKFSREAEMLGLPISIAVLCDPVFRSQLLPTWLPFNPWSISPVFRPSIRVPASVRRVEWVRQCQDIPHGHDLIAEDAVRTQIGRGRYVMAGHTQIDDSITFQEMAEELATQFVHGMLGAEGKSTGRIE